jgi:hypothetical protein
LNITRDGWVRVKDGKRWGWERNGLEGEWKGMGIVGKHERF